MPRLLQPLPASPPPLLRIPLLKQCRLRLLPRRSPLAASCLSQVLLRLTVREDTQPSANQLSAAVSTFASGRVSSQSSPVSPCKQERLFCHGFSLQQGPAAVSACHSRVFFRAFARGRALLRFSISCILIPYTTCSPLATCRVFQTRI